MATEKKIIEIIIPLGDAVKNIAAVQAEIAKLEKEQKELTKENKKGSEQYAANTVALKNYRGQLTQLVIETNNQVKASNDAISAYDKLQAEYSLAAKEAKNLAIQHGAGSEQARKAAASALSMSDRLKEADATVGQHQRNVGNYKDALAGMGGKMSSVVDGATQMTVGFKMLSATPLLGILQILMVVFGAISKAIGGGTEAGRKMSQMLAPLTALYDKLMNTVAELTKIIIGAFAAMGEWLGSVLDFIPAVHKMNEASRESIRIEKEKQRLIREGIVDKAQDAKDELRISVLKKQMAESDKYTAEQRLAFAREIDATEKKLAFDDAERARQNLVNFLDRMKQMGKTQKQYTDDELKEFSELQAAKYTEQQKYYDNTRKTAGKASTLQKEIENEEKARTEANLKAKEDANKAHLDKLQKQLEIYALSVKNATESEIVQQWQMEQEIVRQKQLSKEEEKLALLQLEKKYGDAVIKLLDDRLEKEKAVEKTISDLHKAIIDQDIADGDKSWDEELKRIEQRKTNEANYLQDRLYIVKGNLDAEAEIKKQMIEAQRIEELSSAQLTADQVTAINAKAAEANRQVDSETFNAKLDMAAQVANGLATLFGKETKAGKFAAAAAVGIQSAQSAFKTGALAATYFASGNIPMGILAGVQTGIIVAQGVKAIKDIYAVKEQGAGDTGGTEKTTVTQKFHSGGTIGGAGEVPITALGGESVMNVNTTQMFSPLLSSLNQLGGGKAITAGVGSTGAGTDMLAAAFSKALSTMPSPSIVWKDFETASERQEKFKANRLIS